MLNHISKYKALADKYDLDIDVVRKVCESQFDFCKHIREVEQKLLESTQFIHDTKYTLGECNERGSWVGNTATILDKMLADTKRVYDLYNDALKLVEKEDLEGEGRVKGGGNISMTDSGEM